MIVLSWYFISLISGEVKSEQHLEQIKEELLDTKYEVKEEPCHAELWFKEENEDDIWVKEEADNGEVAESSNVQGELHGFLNCFKICYFPF